MIARILVGLTGALIALSSLVVFEGAGSTATALRAIENAQASDTPSVRSQLLARAEQTLAASWAKPLTWHAGASEAASGAAWLASAEDRAASERARDFALDAIAQAPVQPNAYLRLALLSQAGVENGLCAPALCLERSYAQAPIMESDAECARLGVAYRTGMLAIGHERLSAFVTRTPRRQAIACLATFLPADEAFRAALGAPTAR